MAATLCGCGFQQGSRSFDKLADASMKIKPAATEQEVERMLGKPQTVESKGRATVWGYTNQLNQLDMLAVSFKDGKCVGVMLQHNGEGKFHDYRNLKAK